MIRDEIPPTKRPIGKGMAGEDFLPFCHPDRRSAWFLPFIGPDGELIAGNGTLTLRFTGFLAAEDARPASTQAEEALARKTPPIDRDGHWRPLDDARGTIYRYGPRPIYFRSKERAHFNRGPSLRLGAAAIIQLATLQLIARLPRAEVWTDNPYGKPLQFRFNGGTVVVEPMPFLDPPKFQLFTKRGNPMKGGLL